MSEPLKEYPSLPIHRAFVVQFRAGADLNQQGSFSGRVEHVLSGQGTQFSSVAELVEFFRRILGQEQQPRGP